MRIGIEAQRIFRKKRHGMDIVALETIRQLQQMDTENDYFIFVRPGEDSSILQESPKFHIVPLKALSYADWEQIALPLAAKKYKLDVLHCTSNTAPFFCPVPLVVTIHDVIYMEKMNLRKGSWYQKLGFLYRRWNVPFIAKKAKAIITVSDYERTTIVNRLGLAKERVQTIYNGVSEHFHSAIDPQAVEQFRKEQQLPEQFIFFIGNTDPKKNVNNTVKGYALALQQDPLLPQLVMLDYSPESLNATLHSLNENELIPHIHLMDYVPNTQLPYLYRSSLVFLYTSLRESFGIPMLEAMRCGTPVITSNTSAMPEIAGDAAVLCDPNKPESIANAILKLSQDEGLRNRNREIGLQRAADFSWKSTAENVLHVLKTSIR